MLRYIRLGINKQSVLWHLYCPVQVVLSRKLLLLLLVLDSVLGQEEGEEAGAEEAEECVPCEEAWEYVEFLKTEINVPVTEMLQDFKNAGTAEQTVSQTMNVVMDIREVILTRIKAIRKAEDSVVICPEQNIKQEEKLSEFRMEIMSILLKLVESEAASNLKDISSQLLKFRSSITGEVRQWWLRSILMIFCLTLLHCR